MSIIILSGSGWGLPGKPNPLGQSQDTNPGSLVPGQGPPCARLAWVLGEIRREGSGLGQGPQEMALRSGRLAAPGRTGVRPPPWWARPFTSSLGGATTLIHPDCIRLAVSFLLPSTT